MYIYIHHQTSYKLYYYHEKHLHDRQMVLWRIEIHNKTKLRIYNKAKFKYGVEPNESALSKVCVIYCHPV